MPMTVKHMFGALAVSAAAAMLAACGQSAAPRIDPARTPITQPVKAAGYPAASEDEVLSAETYLNIADGRSNSALASSVRGIQACENIAKERTHSNDLYNRYSRTSITSCVGQDGVARARFECARAQTGEIGCRPI